VRNEKTLDCFASLAMTQLFTARSASSRETDPSRFATLTTTYTLRSS